MRFALRCEVRVEVRGAYPEEEEHGDEAEWVDGLSKGKFGSVGPGGIACLEAHLLENCHLAENLSARRRPQDWQDQNRERREDGQCEAASREAQRNISAGCSNHLPALTRPILRIDIYRSPASSAQVYVQSPHHPHCMSWFQH